MKARTQSQTQTDYSCSAADEDKAHDVDDCPRQWANNETRVNQFRMTGSLGGVTEKKETNAPNDIIKSQARQTYKS